jgi:hypothetical protein
MNSTGNGNGNGTPQQIRVTPRVNLSLGGIYQAIMLCGALIGGGLAIVSVYFTLASRVETLENWRAMAEEERKSENKILSEFEMEMRAALGKLQDTLGDIRERLPKRNGP